MIRLLLPLLTTAVIWLLPCIAHAQTYTPSNRTPQADNSLGTQVTGTGTGNNFNITGGLQRGQNLFHSFSDFSIPTNGTANFTNPTGNQSIITRVTGNLFSDLNGALNSNGANFLLINPNGVVFGPGVRLNFGKAFVASTASGIEFVDAAGRNYNFGVNKAADVPLIAIDPNVAFNPAKLLFSNPGSKGIENYGTLRTTNPNQYIGLIGGDVKFNGGKITAPGAKVELGGLLQSGTVNFSLNDGVIFPANVERGNVSLVTTGTSPSFIVVEASRGGSVEIFGKDITLQGVGTVIRGGIVAGAGSPTAKAGNIKLDATGDIRLADSDILNRVNVGGVGEGGNIEINTRNLIVTNGAQLIASTLGKGDAGNVNITAIGNISLDGRKNGSSSGAFSKVEKGAMGKGGNVEINTRNLTATNGAQLTTSTFGQGDAGNVKIIAIDNVSFDGRKDGSSTVASSRVEQTGVGKGGNIEINTRNLTVTNGAQLTASTFGRGDAGNVKIIAIDNVSFDGRKDGSSTVASSRVEQTGVGKGGNIEINTRNLTVTNGAQLTASTFGQGDAGDIILKANIIKLDRGQILSTSNGSTGGDVNIIINDYLLLSNNSFITTNSASTGKNGNGGNININSPLIIATPSNNDITANAVQGSGGRVKITSQGLFGIQYRPRSSPLTNDITASSTFGQSGNIEISTPGIDPGKDTGELPVVPNDASKQISQACGSSQRDNKFYVTGRGGLPPNASEPLESEALWQDARAQQAKPLPTAIQPAQLAPPTIGWVFEKDGMVHLIAAQTGAEVVGGKQFVCPNQ
jgi:filamentous hemagglutinin family protein